MRSAGGSPPEPDRLSPVLLPATNHPRGSPMQRMHHRVLPTLVAAVAALSLGAAPALAGSDGCAGGDCQDQNTPVQPLPQAPVPVAPAPAAPTPAPAPENTGGTAPEQSSSPKKKT